ncbi:MAG: hypothetical protein ACOVQX_02555, partial [Legionella sp.]
MNRQDDLNENHEQENAFRVNGQTMLIAEQIEQVKKATSKLEKEITNHQRGVYLDRIRQQLHNAIENAIEAAISLSSGHFEPRTHPDNVSRITESPDTGTNSVLKSFHIIEMLMHQSDKLNIDPKYKFLHALLHGTKLAVPVIGFIINLVFETKPNSFIEAAKKLVSHMGNATHHQRQDLYRYVSAYNTIGYISILNMLSDSDQDHDDAKKIFLTASLMSIAEISESEPFAWAKEFKKFFDGNFRKARSSLLIKRLSQLSKDSKFPVANEVRAALAGERTIDDFLSVAGRTYQRQSDYSIAWLDRIKNTLTDPSFTSKKSLFNRIYSYWLGDNWKDRMLLALMIDSCDSIFVVGGTGETEWRNGVEFAKVFAKLPARVTHLDLSSNHLARLGHEQLSNALLMIPSGVTTLNLKNNGLPLLSRNQLGVVFAAIPTTVSSLKLAEIWILPFSSLSEKRSFLNDENAARDIWYRLTSEHLLNVLSMIPCTITKLYLDSLYNRWEFTPAELVTVLNGIPAHVTWVELGVRHFTRPAGQAGIVLPLEEISVNLLENRGLFFRDDPMQNHIITALFWEAIKNSKKIPEDVMGPITNEMVDFFSRHILTQNSDNTLKITAYEEIDIFTSVGNNQIPANLPTDPTELRDALAASEARAQAERAEAARDREASRLRDEAAARDRAEASRDREASRLRDEAAARDR